MARSYSLKLKSKDVNIWFTSDTHYGHSNICKSTSSWSDKSECRDFKTLDSMNKHLVDQINRYVDIDDLLIHLGDWSFGGKDNITKFRNELNCNNIILIPGNHDHHIINNVDNVQKLFKSVNRYDEIVIDDILFCLMHFPLEEWNDREFKKVVHLHGHLHGDPRITQKQNRFDVGIDNAFKLFGEYKPFSLFEIINILKTE